jgi:pimeloyl-ACP methyl ester carboxylesterase
VSEKPSSWAALAASILAVVGGCHTSEPPEVVEPTGDEVTIFVPGIKGSFLETAAGERAWLEASDLLSSGDRSLALPPGGDDRFGPLEARGVLTRFTVIPFIASADVYLSWLELGHDHLPGFLPLAYDWRHDARETVRELARRIDELAAKRPGLRVNLVGHSLGGLIALTYVRYGSGDPAKGITWAGARHVKRLALVGAPFGGSPAFLADILRGDKNGRNVRLLAAEAMASFTSSFELLPYPGTFFVDRAGAPLPLDARAEESWRNVPPERRPTAAALTASRAFREGLLDDAKAPAPPPDLRVIVVVGTGRDTVARVTLAKPDDVDTADFEASPVVPGDSRVPEAACLPPKPLDYTLVRTAADHVGLLDDEAVQDAIRELLERRNP